MYIYIYIWLVVWNMFYFSIYFKSSSQLTNILQRDWNHQPDKMIRPRNMETLWRRVDKHKLYAMKQMIISYDIMWCRSEYIIKCYSDLTITTSPEWRHKGEHWHRLPQVAVVGEYLRRHCLSCWCSCWWPQILGKFHHDLTATEPWEWWCFYREIIPFYGRTVQVSQLLEFTQTYGMK